MLKTRGFRLLAAAAALMASSCADLEDIELGRCGNRVLDEGEDCDGHDAGGSICGVAGERNECRYTCNFGLPDASAPCPEGYRCGAGDVCSRPSNRFTLEEAPVIARGGDAFATADFDGDRLNDVAIVSEADAELAVTFLGGLTPILETTVPISATRTLALGRIDTDERPDVALGADAAVASLGSPTGRRELVSTAFAQYTFGNDVARVLAAPAQSNVYPDPAPAQAKLEADADSEAVVLNFAEVSQLYIRNAYDNSTPVAGNLPVLRDLVGITRGPVFARSGPACDEIVFAYSPAGAASLVVQKLCHDDGGAPIYPLPDGMDCDPTWNCVTEVPFASSEILGVWPAQLAEEDNTLDAQVELVVVVRSGSGLDVTIVDEDPTGVEALRTRSVVGGKPAAVAAAGGNTPLFVGDLNGDAQLDVITSVGIFSSGPDGAYVSASSSSGRWDEAAVGDFNRDGLLDVAAGRRDANDAPVDDLDVLLASANSYYNPVVLPTDGKASVLGVGDFDGDGADDLVFRSRAASLAQDTIAPSLPSCTELDDLLIFFGSPNGLGERSTLGRIPGIEQLAVGRLPRLDKRDGISDFGIVSHCSTTDEAGNPEPDANRVAVFYGALSRQIAAPYLLNDTRGDGGLEPLDLVPFKPDAIATYETQDARLVATAALRLDAYASLVQPIHAVALFVLETRDDVVFKVPHYLPLALSRTQDLSVAFADLDGDGQPEVAASDGGRIQLVDRFECFPESYETGGVKFKNPSDPCSQGQGSDAEFNTDQLAAAFMSQPITTPIDVVVRLAGRDVDQDGFQDLLVVGSSGGKPAILVLWGAAAFDPTVNTLLTFEGEGAAVAAAFLPTYPETGAPPAGTAIKERIVVSVPSAGAVELVAIELSGRAVASQETLASLGDVSDLSVSDLDGDGFEDLAVLTSQSVRILRREPVLAGDAATAMAGGDP